VNTLPNTAMNFTAVSSLNLFRALSVFAYEFNDFLVGYVGNVLA
jgi:hypothetical protein